MNEYHKQNFIVETKNTQPITPYLVWPNNNSVWQFLATDSATQEYHRVSALHCGCFSM